MRPRRFIASLALLLAGCAAPSTNDVADAERSCSFTVGFRPGMVAPLAKLPRLDDPPRLRGSWDGFASDGAQSWSDELAPDGTEWRLFDAQLPPGTYQYFVDVGGHRVLDELQPRTAFIADPDGVSTDPLGTEASEIVVGDCTQPQLTVLEAHGGADAIRLRARFTRGHGGPALDVSTVSAELFQGATDLGPAQVSREGAAGLDIVASHLPPGKYTVALAAADAAGRAAEPVRASAFVEATPDRALADGLVYQLMIDRFRDASGALAAPSSPGDRAGGTLDGVRAAVEAGYFDRLGVTTLWLSPVYQNPSGVEVGRDGHLYQAYHGYWPSQPRTVEDLFGGEAALDALIASAHARGLRVILDVVPHHVDVQHPYYQAHSQKNPTVAASPDPRLASWFVDDASDCICGIGSCDWGSHMETCWFDHYLPTMNWRLPAVMQQGSDDLVWWTQRFDLDGLRFDAVPMMPRAGLRRMIEALRAQTFSSGLDRLLVGEVFTGPGESGRETIRAYLGESLFGLDSAFDFPLMWSLRDVVAHRNGGFPDVEAQLQQASSDFAGSGATLAHMLGNHDTTRFLSEAVDANVTSVDPWSAPPPQPTDPTAYQKQLVALAYLLTTPGLPVIYYGDELGLAGASDPDSRRVLPDVLAPDSLLPVEKTLLDQVSRLGRLRRCLPALRSSNRVVASIDADHLVSVHDQTAIVALSRAATPSLLHVASARDGRYVDVLSNAVLTVENGATNVPIGPLSAAVFIPEASPCVE